MIGMDVKGEGVFNLLKKYLATVNTVLPTHELKKTKEMTAIDDLQLAPFIHHYQCV